MKNSLFIDVDTDRDQMVLIGKPPEIKPPANAEEAKQMIMNDISCTCEALVTLINIASASGYGDKEDLFNTAIKYFNESNTPTESTPEDNKEE